MSGIVKSKPLPFLYVIDQKLLDSFAKVCKKDAPLAYTIPQKFLPYVKRYTSRTYQQVELVDGSIINTRDFKRRPNFYTSHITLTGDVWGKRISFRLSRTETEGGLLLDHLGVVIKNLNLYVSNDKSRLRLAITGNQITWLETFIPITEKIANDIHEIGNGFAYCIRALIYGTVLGQWDERYFNLLLMPFNEVVRTYNATERRKLLRKNTDFLPSIPHYKSNLELLSSLESLVCKIGDFDSIETYSVKNDFYRLNKLAEWLDENNYDGGYTGTGFSNALRESNLADSHPEIHKSMMHYCVHRGTTQWNFAINDKKSLLDRVYGFLNLGSNSQAMHSNWINVMRAVILYKRGEIPMFDNSVAGHQLAKLNELSGGVMRKKTIQDVEDLSFNKVRIRHLYLSLIKPVLSKMMKEQKSNTTTGE